MNKIGYIQEYSGDTSVPTDGFYTSRMLPRKLNEVIDILNLLIEQAESQEPKALEESVAYKCGGYCGGLHGPECKVAKPQEEPKKCCEVWCVACEQSGVKNCIHTCPCHKKETEPKKQCWCGHTDGHVLNTNVPFIKSQE